MNKYEMLFKITLIMQDLGCVLLYFLRLGKYVRDKKELKTNMRLYSKKQKERCYVIGLGPSLNRIDFKKLNGDTIVVNNFHLYPHHIEIDPTFHVMIDNDYFISQYKQDVAAAYTTEERTTFIMNGRYMREIREILPDTDRVCFIDSWGGRIKENEKFVLTKLLPLFPDCVCCGIGVAIALGYKEIVLLGCDFSHYASSVPEYCYEDERIVEGYNRTMLLYCYAFISHAHSMLAKCANNQGIKIFNASYKSLLEAYVKTDDNELLRDELVK